MSEISLQTRVSFLPSHQSVQPRETKIGCSLDLRQGRYHIRLALSEADRRAAFRLRFLVFNLELNEGLEAAYATGQDTDEFDAVCDHLIVEHSGTGTIVGTYRLQTAAMAAANAGFYSEREFEFSPYKELGDSVIELGRACVHRDHRSSEVLYWWNTICVPHRSPLLRCPWYPLRVPVTRFPNCCARTWRWGRKSVGRLPSIGSLRRLTSSP